jgi:hypothetical protein
VEHKNGRAQARSSVLFDPTIGTAGRLAKEALGAFVLRSCELGRGSIATDGRDHGLFAVTNIDRLESIRTTNCKADC